MVPSALLNLPLLCVSVKRCAAKNIHVFKVSSVAFPNVIVNHQFGKTSQHISSSDLQTSVIFKDTYPLSFDKIHITFSF